MIALNSILIFYFFCTNLATGTGQELRNSQSDHEVLVRNTSSVDLGDGFYVFEYNNNGDIVNHEFTPLAHIDLTEDGVSEPDFGTPVKREFEIRKRAGTTCSDSFGKRKDHECKMCLRAKAGGRRYNKHTSAHCTIGNEKAYLCNYQEEFITKAEINHLQGTVDSECGMFKNGFTRCTNDCGVSDLAVGRSKKSSSICGF